VLNRELAERFFSLPGTVADEAPVAAGEVPLALRTEIEKQQAATRDSIDSRNQTYFTEEEEKLNARVEDIRAGLEGEIKQLDKELTTLKKQSKLAKQLEEKIEAQKKLKALNESATRSSRRSTSSSRSTARTRRSTSRRSKASSRRSRSGWTRCSRCGGASREGPRSRSRTRSSTRPSRNQGGTSTSTTMGSLTSRLPDRRPSSFLIPIPPPKKQKKKVVTDLLPALDLGPREERKLAEAHQ
jgi:hypothetical protein